MLASRGGARACLGHTSNDIILNVYDSSCITGEIFLGPGHIFALAYTGEETILSVRRYRVFLVDTLGAIPAKS